MENEGVFAAYQRIMDGFDLLRGVAPVKLVAAPLHAQVVEGIEPGRLKDAAKARAVVRGMVIRRMRTGR